VTPLGGREVAPEVAEQPRRVLDRVRREEDVPEPRSAQRGAERVRVHAAMDADEPADAVEREAEAERDRRELARDGREDARSHRSRAYCS
jgi:hypothetical protein